MNKQELSALVAEILATLPQSPQVKGGEYKPHTPGPQPEKSSYAPGDFVPDITALDLRKLYLTENAKDKEGFARLKERTPARLGSGRAGPRYKTLTMLRFRADHAAAQDAVFSQVPEGYAKEHDFLPVQTCCESKDMYLTRPDLGRRCPEATQKVLKEVLQPGAKVQLVVGEGLSSAAIMANAGDCVVAIQEGLKAKGISVGKVPFVRYCRVGAGDAIGDIPGCEVVCMLVGERPGVVTDKSMSCYITYKPHTGVSEASRTVGSNIHSQGTPAVEAGAHVANLIGKILEKKVSGVGLHLEG